MLKIHCLAVLTLAMLPVTAARADWAPPYDYIAHQSVPFFKDKSPKEIARYLAAFNDGLFNAAVQALAAHGESVLPLVEQLMTDTNPWIRGGAVATLGEIYKSDGKDKDKRKMTPQVEHAIALASKLLNDEHPAVQNALGQFGESIRVETPETQKIAVRMAASGDAVARSRALSMGRMWLKDPETLVKIGMLASAAPDNTPGDWDIAHGLVMRFSTKPISRQAIPTMAAFLRNKANTRPYRGFFSDNAQYNALVVFRDQWDEEVEKMPDVVSGIIRSYTRIPYGTYPGWVKTRKLDWELLQKCTAESVPAIRATIAEEKQWLAEITDSLLQTTTETKPAEAREKAKGYIADVEKLADGLKKK